MQSNENSEFGVIPLYNNRDYCQDLTLRGVDFGIDKLKLTLQSFDFDIPNRRLNGWESSTRENDRGTITNYFRNNQEIGYNVDIQGDYMSISTNPSKRYHPFALTNNADRILSHLEDIESDIKKTGMGIELGNCRVSRIDLAKNIITKHPLEQYVNVFDSWQGKRMIKKKHDNTIMFGNTQHQFQLYHKGVQLGIEKEYPNLLRGEIRLLNLKSVDSIIKGNNLKDIFIKSNTHLDVFNNYLKTRIFQGDGQLKFDFGEMEDFYLTCIKQCGEQKGYNKFLKTIGVQFLATNPKGIDNIIEIIRRHCRSKETFYRRKKEVLELLGINIDIKNKSSFAELNYEIRMKLLAA